MTSYIQALSSLNVAAISEQNSHQQTNTQPKHPKSCTSDTEISYPMKTRPSRWWGLR